MIGIDCMSQVSNLWHQHHYTVSELRKYVTLPLYILTCALVLEHQILADVNEAVDISELLF